MSYDVMKAYADASHSPIGINQPVCTKPECGLMHKGLSNIYFLCSTCSVNGATVWHPIADHPKTQNH